MSAPVVDYHVHIEEGLSLERALQLSRERDVRFGIVEHGGYGQAINDDASLIRYSERLSGSPVYAGMQAEGLDWAYCFSTEAIARLDYVLSDALTFPERDGRQVRLWHPDVTVEDEQDFMDRYVDFNVRVISGEPIDILGNPTFLPVCLAGRYDVLWTPERIQRVIDAAVAHDVAIEINARYRIPSIPFVRMAAAAGCKFSFGSNEHGEKVGLLDYCLEVAQTCGLTADHMFAPKPPGMKPAQVRQIPANQGTIVGEWATVSLPPPPELVPVTVDAEHTVLLVLDLQNQNCSLERRPRCVASLLRVQRLLAQARQAGMPVVYSLTPSATAADVRAEVAPLSGEPVVRSGVDKFYGTELEDILRQQGVETVILVGTSAHGAVLHTATGAALRGLQVVVPVDGMSAEDAYAEQYTAWHLAKAPGTRRQVALTRIGLIRIA